jgi:hypothetical protein
VVNTQDDHGAWIGGFDPIDHDIRQTWHDELTCADESAIATDIRKVAKQRDGFANALTDAARRSGISLSDVFSDAFEVALGPPRISGAS